MVFPMFRCFLSGFCLFGIFLWHQTLIWTQPRICKPWLRLLTPDRKWTTCCQTFSTASFVGRLLGWEKVISSNDWCWLASLVVKTILRNLPNWRSASLLRATWTTLQLPAVSWWKKSSQPFEICKTLQPKTRNQKLPYQQVMILWGSKSSPKMSSLNTSESDTKSGWNSICLQKLMLV